MSRFWGLDDDDYNRLVLLFVAFLSFQVAVFTHGWNRQRYHHLASLPLKKEKVKPDVFWNSRPTFSWFLLVVSLKIDGLFVDR